MDARLQRRRPRSESCDQRREGRHAPEVCRESAYIVLYNIVEYSIERKGMDPIGERDESAPYVRTRAGWRWTVSGCRGVPPRPAPAARHSGRGWWGSSVNEEQDDGVDQQKAAEEGCPEPRPPGGFVRKVVLPPPVAPLIMAQHYAASLRRIAHAGKVLVSMRLDSTGFHGVLSSLCLSPSLCTLCTLCSLW